MHIELLDFILKNFISKFSILYNIWLAIIFSTINRGYAFCIFNSPTFSNPKHWSSVNVFQNSPSQLFFCVFFFSSLNPLCVVSFVKFLHFNLFHSFSQLLFVYFFLAHSAHFVSCPIFFTHPANCFFVYFFYLTRPTLCRVQSFSLTQPIAFLWF